MPAIADIARPFADRTVAVNAAEDAPSEQRLTASDSPSAELLAQGLISTGLIGIGLTLGGLALVAHRRRQW